MGKIKQLLLKVVLIFIIQKCNCNSLPIRVETSGNTEGKFSEHFKSFEVFCKSFVQSKD